MYDAMHAVSHGAVPEISKGSSAEGDEDDATPKGLFLRRAAAADKLAARFGVAEYLDLDHAP